MPIEICLKTKRLVCFQKPMAYKENKSSYFEVLNTLVYIMW